MAPRTRNWLIALGVVAAIVGLELGFDTILADASLRGLVMMLAEGNTARYKRVY